MNDVKFIASMMTLIAGFLGQSFSPCFSQESLLSQADTSVDSQPSIRQWNNKNDVDRYEYRKVCFYFGKHRKQKCGIVNSKGEEVTPLIFDFIGNEYSENGLVDAQVESNQYGLHGKYGYINRRGEWIIPPQFDKVGKFLSDGEKFTAGVKIGDDWGIIDDKGEFIINPNANFEYASGFYKKNCAAIGLKNTEGGKRVKITRKGEIVENCDDEPRSFTNRYEWIGKFSKNGLAPVTIKICDKLGKFETSCTRDGFINKEGEMVIPAKYLSVASFDDKGMAKVEVETSLGISFLGIIPTQSLYGYIDEKGKKVIDAVYKDLGSFVDIGEESRAKARKDGKYGYINRKGEEAIPFQFSDAHYFNSNGTALVRIDGVYKVINLVGEVIQNTHLSEIEWTHNGMTVGRKNKEDDNLYIVNDQNEIVGISEANWVDVTSFDRDAKGWGIGKKYIKDLRYIPGQGVVNNPYKKRSLMGYVNRLGNFIMPPKFVYAGDFAENGLALVSEDGKTEHLMDRKGNYMKAFDGYYEKYVKNAPSTYYGGDDDE